MRDIKEHRGFGDLVALDPVKFAIAQHRHFAGGLDAQPGRIEQPHQMAHRHHPGAAMIGQGVGPGHEDIHAPLHRGQGGFQGLPKLACNLLPILDFVKRMKPAPQIVGGDEFALHIGKCIAAGRIQRGIVICNQLFFSLKICGCHGSVFMFGQWSAASCQSNRALSTKIEYVCKISFRHKKEAAQGRPLSNHLAGTLRRFRRFPTW